MGRNHENYFLGKFSIEPMGSRATPRKTYTIFTGKVCDIYERISFKKKGTFHWLAIGFDDDGLGPTKHLFFNVANDREIIWLFQMSRCGRILEKGDDVTIEYSGKAVTIIINGEQLKKVSSKNASLFRKLCRCRIRSSINEVLLDVCPWASQPYITDELEAEAVFRCREFLCNMIADASDLELKDFVCKLVETEGADVKFKDLYEKLLNLHITYDGSNEVGESELLGEEEECLTDQNEFNVNDFED